MAKERVGLIDQVSDCERVWAHNRALYPGWLILPAENRESVWVHTERWLSPILQVQSQLPSDQRLRLLYELNWRMERCLAPLFEELAEAIEDALRPSVSASTERPTAGRPAAGDKTMADVSDWPSANQIRIDLSFACLRYAREKSEEERFNNWARELEPRSLAEDEFRCRLLYEHCLWALYVSDHREAKRVLASWDVLGRDPVWQIRRAAVLAEIGDLRSASEAADAALRDIRRQLVAKPDCIFLLSRECWAMMLASGLAWNSRGSGQRAWSEMRGRWDELGLHRCSPRDSMGVMEATLEGPAPGLRPFREEEVGFDPGSRTQTFHSQGDTLYFECLPALQFQRLAEEAGYPPRTGMALLGQKEYLRAASWLEESFPHRTLGVMLRVGDKSANGAFFCRHRVASLCPTAVNTINGKARNAIEDAMAEFPRLGSDGTGTPYSTAIERGATNLALLSRVCVRLSEEEAAQLVRDGLRWYGSIPARQGFRFLSELDDLLRRLLESLPPSAIAPLLLDIVSLPMPSAAQNWKPIGEWYTDPSHYVRSALPHSEVVTSDNRRRWRTEIRRLVRLADRPEGNDRYSAVSRLACLFRNHLLTRAEESCFARSLWNHVDEHGLPVGTRFQKSVFLLLPDIEPGNAERRFRGFCLGSSLPGNRVVETDPTGRKVTKWVLGSGPAGFLDDVRNGSATLDSKSPRSIRWSEEDTVAFLSKIGSWWQEEGRVLLREHSMFMSDLPERSMRSVLRFLEAVILPTLSKDEAAISQAFELISEMAAAGVPTTSLSPLLLRFRPEDTENAARELRSGLVSPDRQQSSAALRGVYNWFAYSHLLLLPTTPRDLLLELGSIVASRRQPSAHAALYFAGQLLLSALQRPEGSPAQDDVFVHLLLDGLGYLEPETQYRFSQRSVTAAVPYEQVPEYRLEAAHVAALLSRFGYSGVDVVRRWVDAARSDPLPEVRAIISDVLGSVPNNSGGEETLVT